MFKKMISIVAVAGLVLALTGSAPGAMIISMSSSAPTANVAISQTGGGTLQQFNYSQTGDNMPRDAGQSFLVGPGGLTLDKITVNLNRLNTPNYDGKSMTLEIFTLTDGSDFTPNSTVSTEGGSFLADMQSQYNSNNTYLTFDITDVALSAGQQYGFLLMHDANVGAYDMRVHRNSAGEGGYTDGIGIVQLQSTTFSAMGGDLEFYLQAVPEPATMSLLALGGLAVLRRRRK